MIWSTVLVVGLVAVLLLMFYVSRRSNGLDSSYYKKRWSEIEQTARSGDSGLKIAVIDGDKLVNQALKSSRVHGDTMGERMKQASYLKSIDSLWQAHKLRNKLVHETDVKLKESTAQSALSAYRKTLKELGAL